MTTITNSFLAQILVIYTRYLFGGAFVFASLIKIKGERFAGSGDLSPIHTVAHLFDTLYQSGLYWQFIGVSQLLAGGLLMTQTYAKLGALINLPIILNIVMITLSYDFGFTPVITVLMLLANLLLIAWDWNSLKTLVNLSPTAIPPRRIEGQCIWKIIGFILFGFTLVYRLLYDQYNGMFWLGSYFLIGSIGLGVGLSNARKTVL